MASIGDFDNMESVSPKRGRGGARGRGRGRGRPRKKAINITRNTRSKKSNIEEEEEESLTLQQDLSELDSSDLATQEIETGETEIVQETTEVNWSGEGMDINGFEVMEEHMVQQDPLEYEEVIEEEEVHHMSHETIEEVIEPVVEHHVIYQDEESNSRKSIKSSDEETETVREVLSAEIECEVVQEESRDSSQIPEMRSVETDDDSIDTHMNSQSHVQDESSHEDDSQESHEHVVTFDIPKESSSPESSDLVFISSMNSDESNKESNETILNSKPMVVDSVLKEEVRNDFEDSKNEGDQKILEQFKPEKVLESPKQENLLEKIYKEEPINQKDIIHEKPSKSAQLEIREFKEPLPAKYLDEEMEVDVFRKKKSKQDKHREDDFKEKGEIQFKIHGNTLSSNGDLSEKGDKKRRVTFGNLKRKLEDSNSSCYDPSSPTSENSQEEQNPPAKRASLNNPGISSPPQAIAFANPPNPSLSPTVVTPPPKPAKDTVNKLSKLPPASAAAIAAVTAALCGNSNGVKIEKIPEIEEKPVLKIKEEQHKEPKEESKEEIIEEIKEAQKDDDKDPTKAAELEKYWKAVRDDPSDFTGWTYLLQYVDQENDVEAAREAYDAFLSHYPYCYGYWRKYADYEKKKDFKDRCEKVFERGLTAIPLSVDLWIHYLNYCKSAYTDQEDRLRSEFERAVEICGIEFRSDRLWDSYIKWETENKQLPRVLALYDRLLTVPTQAYTTHFDNFQVLVNSNAPINVLPPKEFIAMRREVLNDLKRYKDTDDSFVPEDIASIPPLLDDESKAIKEKVINVRRKVHKATTTAVADRWNFEEGIKRPYFHVKPLERCQLKNWKEYLDYEISQGDFQRIIVLFERCLIACALYEEFWMKFVRFLESIPEDQTEKIREVYERACLIHHTKKPNLHLNWATFEETRHNGDKAREVLANLEEKLPALMQVYYKRINLERRLGNPEGAAALYEYYIANHTNKVISNNMAIKYARYNAKVLNDPEKAAQILNMAIESDPDNPRLRLQLIDLAMQTKPLDIDLVVSVIDRFLERDIDADQKVLFAQRKIEFLEDFATDVLAVQKAQDEFQKLLKQAKDKKKKGEEKGEKKSKSSTSGAISTTTEAASTNSSSAQYSQYGQYTQAGYQGQYPYSQQYQSGDPNYANYQNWGYSQAGYGNYAQGWGTYNYY